MVEKTEKIEKEEEEVINRCRESDRELQRKIQKQKKKKKKKERGRREEEEEEEEEEGEDEAEKVLADILVIKNKS